MNTQEKLLASIGLIAVVLGAGLRMGHFVEASTGMVLLVAGNLLSMLAYSRYSRRLTHRVNELEEEVNQLRSA